MMGELRREWKRPVYFLWEKERHLPEAIFVRLTKNKEAKDTSHYKKRKTGSE